MHYANSEYPDYLQPVAANLHELLLSKCPEPCAYQDNTNILFRLWSL